MRRAALLVVALLLLCSCSDGEPAAENDATAATTVTSPPTTVTSPPTTTAEAEHDDEGLADLTDVASQLLVTVDELGVPGLVDRGYTPGNCDSTTDEAHPPDVLVGFLASDDESSASVIQELRVYPSIEAAAAAFDAGVFDICADETLPEPTDVTVEVGGDSALRVDLDRGTFITAVIGDAVVSFVISGPVTVDPLEIAAFGVGKILGALEVG